MDTDSVTVATDTTPVVDAPKDQTEGSNPSQPNFLHSPPDSNNAVKSDASDSELSELEDEPALDSVPPGLSASAEPPAAEDDQDDIGEVLPDHWSGTVPVFKPTMDQFKDFKKFVRLPAACACAALPLPHDSLSLTPGPPTDEKG